MLEYTIRNSLPSTSWTRATHNAVLQASTLNKNSLLEFLRIGGSFHLTNNLALLLEASVKDHCSLVYKIKWESLLNTCYLRLTLVTSLHERFRHNHLPMYTIHSLIIN